MTEHHRENNGAPHTHERAADPVLAEILASTRAINNSLNSMRYDIATTREAVERLEKRADDSDATLERHMEAEEQVIKRLSESVEAMTKGFPKDPENNERDPAYHARWHEADIRKWKDKHELMKKIRDYVVIGALGVICSAIGALLISGTKVEVKRVVSEEVRK